MPRTHIPPDDFGDEPDAMTLRATSTTTLKESRAVDLNLIGDPLFLVFTDSVTIEADVEGLFFPDIPKGFIPKGNVLGPFSALREHDIFNISYVGKDKKKRFAKFTVKDKRQKD